MIEDVELMRRARDVSRLWDWLPAFRAVAETQHLPTAAKAMGVSPSSLSRAVGLLEDAIGHPLFERVGRRIVLNDSGSQLLGAVRDAMRGIYTAIEFIDDALFVGPCRISVPIPWLRIVIPRAVERLAEEHPQLKLEAISLAPSDIVRALQQGNIDVALAESAVRAPNVTCDLARECGLSIYAPCGHPLTKKHIVRWTDIDKSEMIGIAHYRSVVHALHDVVPRTNVDDPDTGAAVCKRRGAVTVLPDPIAESLGLVRLRLALQATIPLYLIYRSPLTMAGRAEVVAVALRASLGN